jgi:membrane-associated protein
MFDIQSIVEVGGVAGIGLIVFLESCILPILPGDSLLFTAGFLASQGYLPIVPLYITVCIAAILGDNLGYYIGKKYGNTVFSKTNSFFFNPSHIQKAEVFFKKYGTRAVVLARFMPIVRTFIPIFAGVGKMPHRVFFVYNVIGGCIWSTTLIWGGYYLSNIIPNSEQHIHFIVLGIVIVSFSPAVITYIRNRYFAPRHN